MHPKNQTDWSNKVGMVFNPKILKFYENMFLDAHCQKQWASLGVKFWGKKKSGGDRSWKVALGKGSWIC